MTAEPGAAHERRGTTAFGLSSNLYCKGERVSNSAARLIALSIVILAGGILLGVGSIAQAMNINRGQEAALFGLIMSLLSGIVFCVELFASYRTRE